MSLLKTFTDTSSAGPSGPITAWAWDFGDGNTSTSQNPTHTYAAEGLYNVELTVTGTSPDGTASITTLVTAINDITSVVAAFTYSISSLTATFTDTSTPGGSGPITAWHWDFGDGGTSTSQNPNHTYSSAGTYTVTLTATGTSPDGVDSVTHQVTVSSATGFFAATAISRPTTLAGTSAPHQKSFTTISGLNTILASAVSGDYIYYNGTGVLHASPYTLSDFQPSGNVTIDFGTRQSGWGSTTTGNYVSFEYSGSSQVDAFVWKNCKNLRIYGGSCNAGIGGQGLRMFGILDNCWWLDGYVEKAGSNAIGIHPIDAHTSASSSITNTKLQFEVNRYCMNPAWDNHADKGTGFHGVLIHGNSGHYDNNVCYIYAHDPLKPGESSAGKTWPEGGGGSGIEIGTDMTGGATSQNNNTYGILLVNSLMICNGTNPGSGGAKQTGGNGLNWWGSCVLKNNEVVWAESRNCTGQVSHGTSGNWHTGGAGELVIQHGRHSNTNQAYPLNGLSSSTDAYDRRWGITYTDCT